MQVSLPYILEDSANFPRRVERQDQPHWYQGNDLHAEILRATAFISIDRYGQAD
jgi:hypothetical protein